MAVCLTLIFGPLGLLYVGSWWVAAVMIMLYVPFVLTHTGGLWLVIGGRLFSAAWAYGVLFESDGTPNVGRDATRLLNAAAKLEGSNRMQAIAAYEKIIQLYPNTAASKEAARNIQTLKQTA
jgi:hypothetical protein